MEDDEEIDREIEKFVSEYRKYLLESIEELLSREEETTANDDDVTSKTKRQKKYEEIVKLVDEQFIAKFPLGVADYSRFYVG